MTEQYKQDRLNLLEAMHTIVCAFNHEGAYMSWINLIPDEPSDEDFESIAESDEDMDEAVSLFFRLSQRYGKYGLVVQGDWNQHEYKTFGVDDKADPDEEE